MLREKKLPLILFIFIILLPVMIFASMDEIEVNVEPADTIVNVGDTFTIDIIIKNVSNLGSFQFDCKYMSSIIKVNDVQMGSFLGSTNRTVSPVGPVIDNTSDSGKVTFGGFSFGSTNGPTGTGVLATIDFTAQNAGSTVLNLINVQATDVNGSALYISNVTDGRLTVVSGASNVDAAKTTVEVNPEHLPADGSSTAIITVIPKSSSGNNLGSGQTVSLTTTAGTLLGTVADNRDGTYTQSLQTSTTPGTATITATVNGVVINQRPIVTFTPTSSGITISIIPIDTTIVVGKNFVIDVTIDGATNLGSFQFDVEYLSNVVHADSAWLGSFLASSGRSVAPVGPEIDNISSTGKITFGGFSFGSVNGPDGSGILGRLKFIAQDTGTTAMNLKNLQVTDVNGVAQNIAIVNNGVVKITTENLPVDPERTLITATPDSIPANGVSTSMITVIPKNALGNNLVSGQYVNLATTHGTLLGTMVDNGDGTYSQLLQSPTSPGVAIITATVNSIEMNQKPTVIFTPAVGVIVKIQPSDTSVAIGESFSINVVAANVENLGSFQFDIQYLSRIVHVDSAMLGNFLGSSGRNVSAIGPVIDNAADTGRVTFGGFSFGTTNGPSGAGILAIVQFSVQGSGTTALRLVNVQITDINGQKQDIGAIENGTANVINTAVDEQPSNSLPEEFSLSQNYPNPFNPATIIQFQLAKSGWVTFQICNIKGQKIKTLIDQNMRQGCYTLNWDGTDGYGEQVPSGIYIYQIQASGLMQSRKMIKLK